LLADEVDWAADFIDTRWGSSRIVVHGNLYVPSTLPGLVALRGDEKVGLLTYHLDGDACEIVTLDSVLPGQGVGSALLEAVKQVARDAGCRRLWLVTTNDNLDALRFYQKRGFVLAALHPDAVEQARRLKPEIPLVGEDGIPLRDEIELEMSL
jgi:GNAT superfamily N-acetyltransferase